MSGAMVMDFERHYMTLRQAVNDFYQHASVYGDDGQWQVTAWSPEAMDAAKRLYDLVQPTYDEVKAYLLEHQSSSESGVRDPLAPRFALLAPDETIIPISRLDRAERIEAAARKILNDSDWPEHHTTYHGGSISGVATQHVRVALLDELADALAAPSDDTGRGEVT